MENLETGDILLMNYTGDGFFGMASSFIKFFTQSEHSHCGIVLKDPTFINSSMKGYYLWESSFEGIPDAEDGNIKLGVQIVPLQPVLDNYKRNGYVYVRKLKGHNRDLFNKTNFKKIHRIVSNKPYDLNPKDWINAWMNYDAEPQKTDRFWCSALVGLVLVKLGVLDEHTDWSVLKPCDFSSQSENLGLINDFYFEDEVQL
jgi:hypothetical protein